MIIDAHCHAWRHWPYEPAVPDPVSHGSVEALLYEMDAAGVDQATVVCARIGDGAAANDDDNDYVAAAAARHPDRLRTVADVDCSWRPEYHTPGAAERLRQTAARIPLVGFTHYLKGDNDGWLRSDEGRAFFGVAAELGLIAHLAMSPGWQADLRLLAAEFPTVPFLVHHLGMAAVKNPTYDADLAAVLASAAVPNIYIKVSGFHYASARGWDYPYDDARPTFAQIYHAYGAARLCWGSDFPASKPFLTYQQSLEVVRTHCDFVAAADLPLILGQNLEAILAAGGRLPPSTPADQGA